MGRPGTSGLLVLVVMNLLAAAWLMDWLPVPWASEREPARMGAQVFPMRLQIMGPT